MKPAVRKPAVCVLGALLLVLARTVAVTAQSADDIRPPATRPVSEGDVQREGREHGIVVAHRGLLRHAPENTLAAFRACLELRLGFELDVRRSRDRQLVCVHDATVDRTTDGRGRVDELSLAELQALDAGSWFDPAFREERIPSLDQVFRAAAEHPAGPVLIAMDMKETGDGIEEQVVALARKHGVLDRLVFIGRTIEDAEVRQRLKEADSAARVARLAGSPQELVEVLEDAAADWAYVRFLPEAEALEGLRRAGKRVFLAGPLVAGRERENWGRALDLGIDAVLTDHPLRFKRQRRERRRDAAARRERDAAAEEVRAAVARALPLIERGALGHLDERSCFSCHNQALPVFTARVARQQGFDVNEEVFNQQLSRTHEVLARWAERHPERTSFSGGQADTATYALWTLHLGEWTPDEATAAVVDYLLLRDRAQGYWRPTHDDRRPSEGSAFTTTALAVRGLRTFGTPAQQEQIAERLEAARAWLRRTEPRETEDRVFRLWGLKYVEAEADEIDAAVRDLLETQRADGGWAQTDELQSDAYATGTALATLQLAGGLAVTDSAYRRGVGFLLNGQQPDGSWFVPSRSANRFQSYFETGFPHGEDQWISIAASCWSAAALALACSP